MQTPRGGGISGPAEVKGWSDAEVDEALAHLSMIEANTSTIASAVMDARANIQTTLDVVTWFYVFAIVYLGYVIGRHFTPSEREITR